MTRECLSESPIINVGQTFVTKFGNIRLISVFNSSSGRIGVTPVGHSEIIRDSSDGQVEEFNGMTVKSNFFTIAGTGAHFYVCGPDEEMINVNTIHNSHGNTKFSGFFYWQDGMPGWENVPSQIPLKETYFVVYWSSLISTTVCGYVSLNINGTNIVASGGDGNCVTGIGSDGTVSFVKVQPVSDLNISVDVCDSVVCPPGICEQTFKAIDGSGNPINGVGITIGDVDFLTDSTGTATGWFTTGDTITATARYGLLTEEKTFIACTDIITFAFIEPSVPGFDINVDIPSLPLNQSLRVLQVIKIPFTDSWWEVPGGSKAAWDDITNKLYKAREQRVDCDPAPQRFAELIVGRHFAIFAGDPVTSWHPSDRIFELIDTTTDINVIELAGIPAILSKVCGWLDVSDTDCATSFYQAIPDILFSAEDLSIIIEGKSIYPPYGAKTPTSWNYAFVALTFIPGSGVVKGVGKAGVKAVKGAKLFPDNVLGFIKDSRWVSARFPEKDISFLQVMWDLQGKHLDEVVQQIEKGNIDEANNLIIRYLPEGKSPDLCVKDLGDFTRELFDKLPKGIPETLIREAGLEKSFTMNAGKAIYSSTPILPGTKSIIENIYQRLPSMKKAMVEDAGDLLKNTESTPEQITRVINAMDNYPPVVDDLGDSVPLFNIDDLIENAVNKVGYENTPRLTKVLFTRSLRKALESPVPIALTEPQTTAIKNIVKADSVGFINAMSEFDKPFRLKLIKSLELSGTEGVVALNHAEGVLDVSRQSDIYSTFGYNINDVAHAYTNHFTTMPEYWRSLGVDSIEFAADGRIIEDVQPYASRYLAELAEARLSRVIADALVNQKLTIGIIKDVLKKDNISSDIIVSLYDINARYPLAASDAMRVFANAEPGEFARFLNILKRTDEGNILSELLFVRDELARSIGKVDEADDVLKHWTDAIRTVTDVSSQKSFLRLLRDDIVAYPHKHPVRFTILLIGAVSTVGGFVASIVGLTEFVIWKMKEMLWDPPAFNLFQAVKMDDKAPALRMLAVFKFQIEMFEPAFRLISYGSPFSVAMIPAYVLNTKMTHDLYADMLGVPEQKFFRNEYLIPDSIDCNVTSIIDGDTVDIDIELIGMPEPTAEWTDDGYVNSTVYDHNKAVLTEGGEFLPGILNQRVRLLGINTPENGTHDYSCNGVRHPYLIRRLLREADYCTANEELWHADEGVYQDTKEWIGLNLPRGHIATFKSDLDNQFGKYGRFLAVPFYAGKNVCQESLKAGQSVVFFMEPNDLVNTVDFLAAELSAKLNKIGVWSDEFRLKKGWVKFRSDPTAAEVYLDGVYIDNTVSNVLLWETTVGTHEYRFKKVGYLDCTGTTLGVTTSHTEASPLELPTCTLEPEDIVCPPPNAAFSVSDTSPKVNEAVTFNATASTPGEGQSIVSYSWDFGDETTATGKEVSHVYTTQGLYIAKLTVTNDCSPMETDSTTKSINVSSIEPVGDLTVKTYSEPGVILTGVTVYVDNIDKGNTPVTIKNLPTGSHSVRLEKTNYLGCIYCEGTDCTPIHSVSPCDFTIIIEENVTKVLEVTMQKVFEITITSVPPGATITVDGEPITTLTTVARIGGMNIIEQILAEQVQETETDVFLRKLKAIK